MVHIWATVAAISALMQTAPDRGSAEPMRPGTVVVEVAAAESGGGVPQPFVDAVRSALADADFVVLPDTDHSRYVAQIAVVRDVRGDVTANTVPAKSTHSIGNWGAQGSVTLPSSKREIHDLVVTRLTVSLVSRADHRTVWTGSASTAQVDGTRDGDPAAVGGKLATAILSRFPTVSAGQISVP